MRWQRWVNLARLALMALLVSKSYLANSIVGYGSDNTSNPYGVDYPYQYPPVDAVLDKAPPASLANDTTGATALGAALTVLAAQPQTGSLISRFRRRYGHRQRGTGGLRRARPAPGPSAVARRRVDLLLLLTSDASTGAAILGQEERRTEAACPHNPTPAWLVGQSQLRALGNLPPPTSASSTALAGLGAANATFSRLSRRISS